MDQSDEQRAHPVRVSHSGKKFSVTVQVPEDVAGRWPEWFTTEKLMGEVFTAAAVAAMPARTRWLSRMAVVVGVLLVAELIAAGVVLGYLGAGRFHLVAVGDSVAGDSVAQGTAAAPAVGSEPAVATDAPEPGESSAAVPPTGSAPASAGAGATASLTSQAVVKRPAGFRVQLGALRIRSNADDLVGRLRRDGYQPTIRTVRGLYLVQLGPFRSRSEAERLAGELSARRYDVLVVR